MTKPNSSLIVVVMDRSGSMGFIRDATIESFNNFLRDQKKEPGECHMYYTQFDTVYDIVHHYVPLQMMPELTQETYVPRGGTALLDAIGHTIVQVGADLRARPEKERPSNVIFVIQTDGQENSSREYTSRQKIFEMIAEQRDTWKWNFIFLGASQESIEEAQRLGISHGHTLFYQHSAGGAFASGQSVNSVVREVRTTGRIRDFTDEERQESKTPTNT